jgi:hypothetical protein
LSYVLTDKTVSNEKEETTDSVKSFEFRDMLRTYIQKTKPEGLNAKILNETLTKIKENI